MAALYYTQHTADGSHRAKRSARQGRKPSGLAKPELVRLYADDAEKLDAIGAEMGYLWNRNEFIRQAVRKALQESVYTELLKH